MAATPSLLRSKNPLELVPGKTSYGGGCLTLHRFGPLTLYLFSHVNFYSCDFNSCDLSGARFYDCTFTHCDMRSMVVKGARFVGCTFTGCVAHGTDWSEAGPYLNSSVQCGSYGVELRALIPLSRIWDTLLGDWGSRTPRTQEVEWFESLPGAKGLPRRVSGCPVRVEMPEVMVDREEAYASARGVVWDRVTLRLLGAGGPPHPVL